MWMVKEYLEEMGFAQSRRWWIVYNIRDTTQPEIRTGGKEAAIKLACCMNAGAIQFGPDVAMAPLTPTGENIRTLAAYAADMRKCGHPLPDIIEAAIHAMEG